MKYGDTLRRRSIPEWQLYNIDYNEIKYLIKARTTKPQQSKAIAIPGNVQPTDGFEEQLFVELVSQHERINLFAASKAGEVQCRLVHLDKQVSRMANKLLASRGPMTARRIEIFSKYESEALIAGAELQSLSRFFGANRIAFEKLLKKYQKWTGSTDLGARFHKHIQDNASDFSLDSVETLMILLNQVLTAIRDLYEQARSANKTGRPSLADIPESRKMAKKALRRTESSTKQQSTASHLNLLDDNGPNAEFDTVLATLPFGSLGGNAVYWVHADNLVELQVLLLQHSRFRMPRRRSNSGGSSPTSRRSSLERLGQIPTSQREKLDDVGWIVCDNAECLIERHAASTIGESETATGGSVERAAVGVRWCSEGSALVTARESARKSPPKTRQRVLKVKKKHLAALFDPSQDAPPNVRFVSTGDEAEADPDDSRMTCDDFRQVLLADSKIQPLVQVNCRRMRFSGFRNSVTQGLWLALDQDVRMKEADLKELVQSGSVTPTGESGAAAAVESVFPHALLSVRWEGQHMDMDLVRILDKSHLTERVRGFSIGIHAIATLLKPQSLSPPIWLPLLARDIRKVPSDTRDAAHLPTSSSGTPKTHSPSATSTTEAPNSSSFAPAGESSATSAPEAVAAPPLSAFKKKRKTRRNTTYRRPEPELPQQRYWNEFDDGSEAEDAAYTIFVDPDAELKFPGRETWVYLSHDLPLAALNKVRGWIEKSPLPPQAPSETDPLLPVSSPTHQNPTYKPHLTPNPSSDPTLHLLSTCALISSLLLLLIALLVTPHAPHTPQKPAREIAALVGVAASLTLAVVSVALLAACERRTNCTRRIVVAVVFATVCLGAGGLLARLSEGG
ncbi:MAG: hypothetical protein M1814_001742 [Vezdaea aestivalis]|nr:MAG: hypothetical protein M1814_001742 [Vezdaea aestivalis]